MTMTLKPTANADLTATVGGVAEGAKRDQACGELTAAPGTG